MSTLHRCSSKQMFQNAKDIFPNFPKLARNVSVRLLPTISLPQRSWRPFFGVSSNIKGLNVFFYNRWAHFCEIKQRWAPFLLGFSEILPRLLTNQSFLGCACTPAQPPPTPLRYTALRNIKTTASRITNFKPRIKIVKACVVFFQSLAFFGMLDSQVTP